MMTKAHLSKDMRLRLCKESFICATLLDNLATNAINEKTMTRYEHFHNKKSAFASNLWSFGEAGTIKTGKCGKLGDSWIAMIFMCYSSNHENDCYQMINPETNNVHTMKDVKWGAHLYFTITMPFQKVEMSLELW